MHITKGVIMKKRNLICGLALMASTVLLVGCTGNTNQTVENPVDVIEEVENDVVDELETVEEVNTYDGVIIKEGEEVTLTLGDKLKVEGDDDFEIGFINYGYFDTTGAYRVEFTYTDGDYVGDNLVYFSVTDAERELFGTKGDYTITSREDPIREITIKNIAKNEVTLTVGARYEIQDPITLSGNKGETTYIEDFSYIETDMCFIYLDKDINVESNLAEVIDDIMHRLEDNTGLSYYGEGTYNGTTRNLVELHYGYDPWKGVNIHKDKVDVYIIKNNKGIISSATPNTAEFIYRDIMDYDGYIISINTIAHELMHVLTYKAVGDGGKISMEGIAVYEGVEIATEMKEEYALNYADCVGGQGLFDGKLNGKNAEELFLSDFADDPHRVKEYQYGFYLMTYLSETYGETFYKDYMDALLEVTNSRFYLEEGEEAEALKQAFGEDVFVKFGDYYAANHRKFSSPNADWMNK